MARKRRRFTAEFKARVALEALRERDSVQAIAARHELHPNQVSKWKRQLLKGLPEVFAGGAGQKLAREHEAKIRDLHAKIGELTVERDFFGAGSSAEPCGACSDDRAGRTAESLEAVFAAGGEPVVAILPAEGGARGEPGAHAALGRTAHGVPVLRQPAADAASAPRGRHRGPAPDPATQWQSWGWKRPTGGRARAWRVVFPYLLRGLTISRADHVWCADITYVPVTQGLFYLVAVMDWATRHVLA